MKFFVVLMALMLTELNACAEDTLRYIGYDCDSKANELHLTFETYGYEVDFGKVEGRVVASWELWSLVHHTHDDHIAPNKAIHRRCRLSDGAYEIEIAARPGNPDMQGRCGAWITASAKVSKKKKILYSKKQFSDDCYDWDSPIVTQVDIGPKWIEPIETTASATQFYGW